MKHLFATYMKWKRQECSHTTEYSLQKMKKRNHPPPITPVTLFLFFNSIYFIGVKS